MLEEAENQFVLKEMEKGIQLIMNAKDACAVFDRQILAGQRDDILKWHHPSVAVLF